MKQRIVIDIEADSFPDSLAWNIVNYEENAGSYIKLEANWADSANVKILNLDQDAA
jgi:hypothetical protein